MNTTNETHMYVIYKVKQIIERHSYNHKEKMYKRIQIQEVTLILKISDFEC